MLVQRSKRYRGLPAFQLSPSAINQKVQNPLNILDRSHCIHDQRFRYHMGPTHTCGIRLSDEHCSQRLWHRKPLIWPRPSRTQPCRQTLGWEKTPLLFDWLVAWAFYSGLSDCLLHVASNCTRSKLHVDLMHVKQIHCRRRPPGIYASLGPNLVILHILILLGGMIHTSCTDLVLSILKKL